jgi:hypothetical protein
MVPILFLYLTRSFETHLLRLKLAEVSLSKQGQVVSYGLTSHTTRTNGARIYVLREQESSKVNWAGLPRLMRPSGFCVFHYLLLGAR